MKYVTLSVLSTLFALSEAAIVSWLTAVPLVLLSTSKPANGFFGIFRRRKSTPSPTLDIPEGPVQFPPSFLPQRQSFFNPFGGFSGNFPGFPGSFQGNFMPQQQQSWMPAQQKPSRPFQMDQNPSRPFEMDQNPSIPLHMQQNPVSLDDEPDEQAPPINTEEAESFFTLLAETDENKCISRLVCELGANPSTAGDLGQSISEIIISLTDFPPGSKVSEYNDILRRGQSKGLSSCVSEYSMCDEETYLLMRSNQPDQSEAESAAMLNMPS